MTSESKLGIRKPPEMQCTYINEVLKELDKFRINVASMDEEDSVEAFKDEVLYQIRNIEEHFECVRSSCEGIREWGQEWKDLAKELVREYEPHRLPRS